MTSKTQMKTQTGNKELYPRLLAQTLNIVLFFWTSHMRRGMSIKKEYMFWKYHMHAALPSLSLSVAYTGLTTRMYKKLFCFVHIALSSAKQDTNQ